MSKGRIRDSRFFAILGIFFGLGFALGFLTCFGYLGAQPRIEVVEVFREGPPATSADVSSDIQIETNVTVESGQPDQLGQEAELLLEENYLGNDEDGTFIGGIVANRSDHPFDAVRVAFDLQDRSGETFAAVTETQAERMEPGDRWEFTIYIPYTEMSRFAGYTLHSLVGVTR